MDKIPWIDKYKKREAQGERQRKKKRERERDCKIKGDAKANIEWER